MTNGIEQVRLESDILHELRGIKAHVENLQRCRHLLPSGECALYNEVLTLRQQVSDEGKNTREVAGRNGIVGGLCGFIGGIILVLITWWLGGKR